MLGRRAVLSKISTALAGWGVLSGMGQQSPDLTEIDVRLNNLGSPYINVGTETPDLDYVDELGNGGGVTIGIDEETGGLNPRARTTFEDAIEVENAFADTVTFMIEDVDTGAGDGEPLDFLHDGESVVGEEGAFDEVGITLEKGDAASLTMEVDFMNHSPVDQIEGIMSVVTNDESLCFITTATAEDTETLDSLRRFRDESMKRTPIGRGLVGLYYRISPPIAKTLSCYPAGRTARTVRWLVDRCATLSDRKAETESTTLSSLSGVSLTLLYVVGCLVGGIGHLLIRVRERLREWLPL